MVFNYDIATSWLLVERILDYYTDTHGGNKGVAVLKDAWQKSKAPLLSLFPATGRTEMRISSAPTDSNDVHDAITQGHSWLHNRDTSDELFTAYVDAQRLLTAEEKTTNILTAPRVVNKTQEAVPQGAKATTYIKKLLQTTTLSVEKQKLVMDALAVLMGALKQPKETVLVLSVNPLDLLLLSEHTTGWGSCFNLAEGGYKVAPLALMMDSCTAVAYTYHRKRAYAPIKDVHLPQKMWRQLVFMDSKNQSAFMGREFPSNKCGVAKEARRLVAHTLAGVPLDQPLTHKVRWPSGDDTPETSQYVFSDPISSSVRLATTTYPVVCIGADEVPCVRCGLLRDDDESGFLMCGTCSSKPKSTTITICAACGGAVALQDAHFVMHIVGNFVAYCRRCADILRRHETA